MVVKDNNENKNEKKESVGKKLGLWIARIIVMMLFLYLAAVLFNYLPLLPIYGATYLPLDGKFFKDYNLNVSQPVGPIRGVANSNNRGIEMTQSGGGSESPWGGNITDLTKLYENVYKQLQNKKDTVFNLEGGKPTKTINDLIKEQTGGNNKINENIVISNIIKNMLRNPTTMKTIRDVMSEKFKHFFASLPITTALLKIAEFEGIADVDQDGKVVNGTNFGGISSTDKFNNPEKKTVSVATLLVEQEGGQFSKKIVYDVNKFCIKNKSFWYLKQFFVLVGSTIAAIFMWPIYYLHEVDIIQGASITETGKVEPCTGGSGGKALQIIILILGILFIIYNAYARCYSFTESFVSIFKTGDLGKTLNDIILWVSIVSGVGVGVIGFFIYRSYSSEREEATNTLKGGNKAGSYINSVLSQPLLRGIIDHYGLLKSAFIFLIGAIILSSIWSMSLTGGWMLLAIFAFFFPIAGLILIYLTQSEMSTLFSTGSTASGSTASGSTASATTKIDSTLTDTS